MFGPRAIEVLQPVVMLRKKEEYLFPTTDSMLARMGTSHCHRRKNQKPNKHKTERTLGPHYDVAAYRRAIAQVCKEHRVPRWSPHQLRHNFATVVRRQENLEAARLLLGHSDQATAEIYAERDLNSARELMRKLG
jgi:integrase